jgi:WhiB family redox-sensing transcriptional regulator
VYIDRRPRQPISEEWDWQVFATCRGMDVEIFFHPCDEHRKARERRIEHAKAICQDCPVVTECRDYALATSEPYGVWGGLSEGERALMLGVRTLRHPGPRRRGDPRTRPPAAPKGITMEGGPIRSHRFGLGGTG